MNTERSVVLRSSPDLGFALREIRGDRARTQAHVAASIGLDRSQLAHMEAGRAGRFLDNLLGVLGELGAQITITWSMPERHAVSEDAAPSDGEPRVRVPVPSRVVAARGVESNAAMGETFRRQQEAMQRVLEPIRRQQEAMIAHAVRAQATPATNTPATNTPATNTPATNTPATNARDGG